MPLAMICMALIFVCLIGYWKSESLLMVTIFAAIVGCLIYVPQFLASVQTMEIVPSFAVGSAVGLRGFMSYIFGASLGTSLFGVMVDKMGWHGGFYLLMGVLFAASCSATSLIAVRWNLSNSEKCSARGSITPVGGCPVIHFGLTKSASDAGTSINSDK